jgi:quinol monooxygenase YgiN
VAVLRLTRFKTEPADAEEMLARRNALVDAVRRGFPGLVHAELARIDDQTWMDAWRWESRANAEAALASVADIPEAAAAFSLTRDATAEFADLVDER